MVKIRSRAFNPLTLNDMPLGRGENDWKTSGNGGNDDEARSSDRSGDDKMQICGLREYGRIGAIKHYAVGGA